ncbi:MAG: methyltransferase domain-containing protein [Clostridia bacterium]|nr:methyltransferase domain-containing protein [Clostridia bacterium]
MINIFSSITSFAHFLLRDIVQEGDKVIDATCGNGHDTLFLAQSVGSLGKVFAFDIQATAIDKTRKLLEEKGLLDRVQLFLKGHEHMKQEISCPVKAVMFNLGYLPNSDHSITTLPTTTVQAIDQAKDLLQEGGLITILIYTGHPGGELEKQYIYDYVQALDKREWDVLKWSFLNRSETAPQLIVLSRREGVVHEKQKT